MLLKAHFFTVYVKKKGWSLPLVLVFPLALLQESLQAFRIILWLMEGGLKFKEGRLLRTVAKKGRKRRRRWRQEEGFLPVNLLPRAKKSAPQSAPHGWVNRAADALRAGLKMSENALVDLRHLGPVHLVRVEMADFELVVRLI